MSSPTISQIGAAIGGALTSAISVPPLRYLEYLPDTFTPPVVLVAIDEVDYHTNFGSSIASHPFTLLVVLARSSDRAAIELMEALMSNSGSSSVRAALEADTSLGGVVQNLIVHKAGKPVGLPVGQPPVVYLSIPFDVEVWA